jgi:competence protein ComEA
MQQRKLTFSSRVSERAPQVVYSFSLEEVEAQSQGSLKVDINTADVEELEELPEVGPATAETIIDYRRTNGMFRSVEELASIRNCKNT